MSEFPANHIFSLLDLLLLLSSISQLIGRSSNPTTSLKQFRGSLKQALLSHALGVVLIFLEDIGGHHSHGPSLMWSSVYLKALVIHGVAQASYASWLEQMRDVRLVS